jgi:hypothetical protein
MAGAALVERMMKLERAASALVVTVKPLKARHARSARCFYDA